MTLALLGLACVGLFVGAWLCERHEARSDRRSRLSVRELMEIDGFYEDGK